MHGPCINRSCKNIINVSHPDENIKMKNYCFALFLFYVHNVQEIRSLVLNPNYDGPVPDLVVSIAKENSLLG